MLFALEIYEFLGLEITVTFREREREREPLLFLRKATNGSDFW